MPNKIANDKKTEKAMKKLGQILFECRKEKSLRKVAEPCGISAPQLLSIEKGTLCPTAEVYAKLVEALEPNQKQQISMDRLFMVIRGTPPPDVCRIMINNESLNNVLRQIGDAVLTIEQIDEINNLINTFNLNQGEEKDG